MLSLIVYIIGLNNVYGLDKIIVIECDLRGDVSGMASTWDELQIEKFLIRMEHNMLMNNNNVNKVNNNNIKIYMRCQIIYSVLAYQPKTIWVVDHSWI